MTSPVERRHDEVPDEVYVRFVRSLCDNAHMLLVGAACYGIMAVTVYARTQDAFYLVIAGLLTTIGVWRYWSIRQFNNRRGELLDGEQARRWEWSYIVRASLQGLTLGSFCFYAIYVSRQEFAELSAMSVTLASLVTVVGRNYGSPRMVWIFSTIVIGPPAAALLLRLDLPYAILGLMIVPTTFLTISSATHVREVLFSAVIGRKQARLLATRFDRALNIMPQGLLMFDREGRAIVVNAEAAKLLDVETTDALLGRSMHAILKRIVAAGLISKERCDYVVSQLLNALRNGLDRKLMIELTDGRFFELSAREGDNNLGVVMFDDVTTRVRSDRKISVMARFDPLTSLPNRAHFHEIVATRLASGDPGRSCALAIFDIDDFKGVNDTLGHPIGDRLIRAVGERMLSVATQDSVVGRFGGDEFVLFIDVVADVQALSGLLDDAIRRLGGEFMLEGNNLAVRASGGAVCMTVKEADVDDMIVKADLALYKAKASGKDRWHLFEVELEQAFRERQLLKAALSAAVAEGGLRVVYQPIVNVATMTIAGCEALCRWDHKELGPISPATFIPLAEETGIVRDITAFVLERACVEFAKLPDHVVVSVNLSAVDFRDASIVQTVMTALQQSGLPPRRLEIEVTETALLDDKAASHDYVEQLRAAGVRIALDDFGTGFSSLSYLHRLPLDKIKIDRSFLADISDSERSLRLLDGITHLSHSLGIQVTVEGVETFEQLRILSHQVKPDLVQGFLFGAPLTATGIAAMLAMTPSFHGKLQPDDAGSQRTKRA